MDPQDEPVVPESEHERPPEVSQDEPEVPREHRAFALTGAQAAARSGASRLRRGVRALGERTRTWDERSRCAFVPSTETVVIDVRRHPLLLVAPVLRTLLGLVVLAIGPRPVPLLLFATLVAVWAQVRLQPGLRRTAVAAVGCTVGLVLLDALTRPWLCPLLLLAWLAEDAADWHSDRLVVTDKRIYRRHGVVTRHSPSISLTAVAYIDAAVPPLGCVLRYGTLRLDSVAQRDAPLSRFDLIPDVVAVSHEILRLRTAAMPRFPQQPG